MLNFHKNWTNFNRWNSEGFGYLQKIQISVIFYFTLMGVLCIALFGNYVNLSFEDFGSIKNGIFQRSCEIPKLKFLNQFFELLEDTTNLCTNLTTVGGRPYGQTDIIDGDKKVCLDPEIGLQRGNCTVLSFGISTDWSFDDEMDKNYKCKVYSFDPTIGYKNHDRSTRLKFFNLGLGQIDGYKPLNGKMAMVHKYGTIINNLGLQGLKIDYLKMDVEGSEVHFFDEIFHPSNLLLSHVKQIGMEIHPGRVDSKLLYLKFWKAFHKLKCHGFQLVFSSPNLVTSNHYILDGKVRSKCYEVLLVNAQSYQR